MYSIIIVDDEAPIREGLVSLYPWEEWGFKITGVFENGKKAFEHIQRNKTDIVLTDVKMPIMDGLELITTLELNHINIHTVFLSGYNEFEYIRTALVHGARDYILKPVKPNQLCDIFLKLREELDTAQAGVETMSEGYYEKIVQNVMEYVNEALGTATLEGAASRVNLSQNYLSRVFKRKTGENFSEYLQNCKMQLAAKYLQDISRKTYDIAYELGYDNPKNFSRAFKQFFGKTPREYRNGGDITYAKKNK